MRLLHHAVRLVVREPRRSLAGLVGVAIASALVCSILLFGVASGTTVTRRALSGLAVDAQVVLSPGVDPDVAAAALAADPAVRTVLPFDLAHFDHAVVRKSGSATQTSVGVIVGIDPTYVATTGLFRSSTGSITPGRIAISLDLASNLGAVPGDSIEFTLPGGATSDLVVSDIVSISGADLILGPTDAAHRDAGANPPVNVAVMSRADLETRVLPLIPATVSAADPSSAPRAGGGLSPVFGAEPAIRRELQVQLDHGLLPGDPIAAQGWLDTLRRRVEKTGAGAYRWIDDAIATLEPLASDLAWGQILFIFLALPGIILALALSRLAADATADTTRRHAALLRARGADRRQLRTVFIGGIVLTSLAGSVLGVVLGTAIGLALFGAELAASGPAEVIARAWAITILLTTILATLAAALPLRAQLGEEIAAGRRELQRNRAPLWQRLYLDVAALLGGVVVYVVAGGSGVHPVLNAEGNPTVTLALTSFAAPLLCWAGATLLLIRLVGAFLRSGARLDRILGRLLGPGGAFAGRSLVARVGPVSRVIVVLALAVGFATSVLVFDATYRQQQRIDAELTLGADLKAVPAKPENPSAAARLDGPRIRASTPFVDRVVYVGPEAQDLLAIDVATLPVVAPLSDGFFKGSSAVGAIDALASRPDAILVSAETATDYSVVPGDRIRTRVPDAGGDLRTVDFTMVGIALEFPTAPKDAFLVANQSYVIAQTGDDRISFVLARADGDVSAASRTLVRRLGPDWQVSDVGTTTARLANSITSVDLSDLVLLDVGFAITIAAVGVALSLLAGLVDRRREFATLSAIGAEPRQIRASMVGETLVIGVAGVSVGLVTGALVSIALLQILAGVFDPPADVPAIPLALIGAMSGCIVVALGAAMLVADRRLSRQSVVAALRER